MLTQQPPIAPSKSSAPSTSSRFDNLPFPNPFEEPRLVAEDLGDFPMEVPDRNGPSLVRSPTKQVVSESALDLSQVIAQTLENLLLLIPGKVFANRLSNGNLELVLRLDPEARASVDAVLDSLSLTQSETEPTRAPSAPLRAHILVVEDDPVVRLLIQRSLSRLAGCTVSEAANGREAMAILQSGPMPDVCIPDIAMAEMDGLQLIHRIRQTPHLRDLEVIVCSSVKEREVVMKAAGMRVTRYLVKPFSLESLIGQTREVAELTRSKYKSHLADLTFRLSLPPSACIEVLRGFNQRFKACLETVRTGISQGRNQEGLRSLDEILQAAKIVQDENLTTRITKVSDRLSSDDLYGALVALEELDSEHKRLNSLCAGLIRLLNLKTAVEPSEDL